MFKLKELWDNCKLHARTIRWFFSFYFNDLHTMTASANATLDIEHARFCMVEQQIRTWEVLDPAVLDLLMRVRRENFVPEAHRALAFADLEIPLGHGEHMLPPKLQARMVQALALKPADKVLEIGTGSGFVTALLASLSRHVYSVDIEAEFSKLAASNLAAAGIGNITLETGDGARGWDKHGPYDAILLTGSVPVLPELFQQCLNPGGRLLAIVGEAPAMRAQLVTCAGAGACHSTTLFETCIAPLKNAVHPQRFVF